MGAQDELRAPRGFQAEAAKHSEAVGLIKSKLSGFRSPSPGKLHPGSEAKIKLRRRQTLVKTGTSADPGPHAGAVLSSHLEFTLFLTLSARHSPHVTDKNTEAERGETAALGIHIPGPSAARLKPGEATPTCAIPTQPEDGIFFTRAGSRTGLDWPGNHRLQSCWQPLSSCCPARATPRGTVSWGSNEGFPSF